MKYDTQIEVTEEQYKYLTLKYAGVIAHREELGKYFIKVWNINYIKEIEKYLFFKK